MWPKLIQVNKTDVFIIGGNNENQWIGYGRPIYKKQVFKFNLKTLSVQKMKSMPKRKQAFGICCICNYIYVAGGLKNSDEMVDSCERYDILNDSWEAIVSLPFAAFSHTLVVID